MQVSKSLLVTLLFACVALSATALLIDTNRDGVADLKLVDTTGNGDYDTIVNLNQEFSGLKAKSKLIDLDQDGVPDLKLVDSDEDGIHDLIVQLEVESELDQTPVADPAFPNTPIILNAPRPRVDKNAPIVEPYGSLNGRVVTTATPDNNSTVVVDVTLPPAPLPTCPCGQYAVAPKYQGVEYYPTGLLYPNGTCGCQRRYNVPDILDGTVQPEYKPTPVNLTLINNCTGLPLPKPKVIAPEYYPHAHPLHNCTSACNFTAPVLPNVVAPEYYPAPPSPAPATVGTCETPKVIPIAYA